MLSEFGKYFQHHPNFQFRDNLFNQTGFKGNSHFVKCYLNLRQAEGRIYNDDIVINLPEIPLGHSFAKEWVTRKRSADRLIKNLQLKQIKNIVEIGCGNGWLVNYLAKSLHVDLLGIDINDVELKQAAKLFESNKKMTFAYADIHSQRFENVSIDIFILAGSVQYFSDLNALLHCLLLLLKPGGEIHILDSPFYSDENLQVAKMRSRRYLQGIEPSMVNYYFYHNWRSLQGIKYEVLYEPMSLFHKLRRFVFTDSPFPWIRITRN